jgi:hypothetical protein
VMCHILNLGHSTRPPLAPLESRRTGDSNIGHKARPVPEAGYEFHPIRSIWPPEQGCGPNRIEVMPASTAKGAGRRIRKYATPAPTSGQ